MGVPLGHVGGGQPRDHTTVAWQVDQLLQALAGGEQVAVDQLHALGRPGRAGGVDEGQHVCRGDSLQRGVDVEAGVAALHLGEGEGALRGLAFDDDHVPDVRKLGASVEHLREVLLLADDHPGTCV